MASFALITEGITDQALLEVLLQAQYGPDISVNPIQPNRDATDVARQGAFGGWENVLAHCTLEEWADLLSVNDYLIVQIDSDIAGHANFGVALTEQGIERAPDNLIADVKARLLRQIPPDFYSEIENRVFFAIAVHSAECWLLPLYSEQKKTQTMNCADRLQKALDKKNIRYAKEYRLYQSLCKPWRKGAALQECAALNPSLSTFLASLPAQLT